MARNTSAKTTSRQHSFAQVPSVQIPRSVFNRSCGLKTTFDAGWLVPIFVDEALPGDTWNLRMSSFARLNSPFFPIMDNMFMDFFFFAVPNRLLWSNWQKFCGEQDNPGDSTDFTVPQITGINPGIESLSDYMGLPYMGGAESITCNALHFRAYIKIWNEWFRDENLQNKVSEKIEDGPDSIGAYPIKRRGKRHDYFTSCLPFVQKGTAVSIPLGTTAPVVDDGSGGPTFDNASWTAGPHKLSGGSGSNANWAGTTGAGQDADWANPSLEADLTSAAAATINDLREAFQIQKMLEKDARGGTRYTEILRSHFGVISPDQRLQRPEYLGGGTTRVNVSQVAATSDSGSYNPGDLAAFGLAASDGIGFTKSFVEHCCVLGLVSVRADLTYQQGLERFWSRQTRYDYYWPSLAHLGEQAVLNKEIYWDAATNDDVFGYQERYAEYRYKPSRVTGKLRSEYGSSLDPWHLALDFASLPALNDTFIQDDPPIDRTIAVPSEPHFIADFWFDFKCARPMPTFSVPGLIDHF